jgi:hypothetical protein
MLKMTRPIPRLALLALSLLLIVVATFLATPAEAWASARYGITPTSELPTATAAPPAPTATPAPPTPTPRPSAPTQAPPPAPGPTETPPPLILPTAGAGGPVSLSLPFVLALVVLLSLAGAAFVWSARQRTQDNPTEIRSEKS